MGGATTSPTRRNTSPAWGATEAAADVAVSLTVSVIPRANEPHIIYLFDILKHSSLERQTASSTPLGTMAAAKMTVVKKSKVNTHNSANMYSFYRVIALYELSV